MPNLLRDNLDDRRVASLSRYKIPLAGWTWPTLAKGPRFYQAPPRASRTALAGLPHRWALKRPPTDSEHRKIYFWNTGFRVIG
jgi:hypothetical protein